MSKPHLVDEISENTQVPAYGGPQRDAINSVIDGIVQDVCVNVAALRSALDAIEAQVLQGAAAAKGQLADQVDMCADMKAEVTRLKDIVTKMKNPA